MPAHELLLKTWPIIVTIFSLIGAVAVLFYKVKQHDDFIKNRKRVEDVISTKLYDIHGESIFMPRTFCERCRMECATSISKEITELKEVLSNFSKTNIEMIKFMAKMETIIEGFKQQKDQQQTRTL